MRFQLAVIALCLTTIAAYSHYKSDVIEDGMTIVGSSDSLVSLNQGWNQAMQAGYWYGGDGSMIIPYDYFLNLEQSNSTELFRSDSNIERLRYIPIPTSKWNPDGMPAGFAKNFDPIGKGEWMALSCGGCHTTKLSYQGTSMVINGAATMGDFQTMMKELEEAMIATLEQEEKFDRFAKKILKTNYTTQSKAELRADFKAKTEIQVNFNYRNRTKTEFGFGRVDAFAYAYNNVGVSFLGIQDNHIPGVAPANYNFIWGTAQSDVLQWNGSAPNAPPIAPVLRVLGDVWGGGGWSDLHSGTSLQGYESSASFKDLGNLLSWIKDLQSPKWPELILPDIDHELAEKGRKLYDEQCLACHQLVLTREEQMKPYNAVMVPQAEVGTDRAELHLIETSEQKTGILEGTKSYYIAGEELGPTALAKTLLNVTSMGAMLRHLNETNQQGMIDLEGMKANPTNDRYQYKARPLNGIWATAPFLHNGSVPNLYQLLLPAAERESIFYTGNREFDPLKVGLISTKTEGAFKFDTSLYGNSNLGHEYGVTWTDQQRYELIEFMKTL